MKQERIELIKGRPDVWMDTYIAEPMKNFIRKALLIIPGGDPSEVGSDIYKGAVSSFADSKLTILAYLYLK